MVAVADISIYLYNGWMDETRPTCNTQLSGPKVRNDSPTYSMWMIKNHHKIGVGPAMASCEEKGTC